MNNVDRKQETAAMAGACKHCGGSGRERDASPVELEFPRTYADRGELTQMAEAVHRDPSYISKIASGHKLPGLLTAVRIADYLGVTVDRVIRNEKIMRRLLAASSDEKAA
jgi:transcriptional regulator with XRE-family HTH domain